MSKIDKKSIKQKEITIRLAGDSGDGMQLVGSELSLTSAVMGNDIGTFPDFPAEIRAPMGTVAGVSGFQLKFSDHEIYTSGDQSDALIAMNPAALKASLPLVKKRGILIINENSFTARDLKLAEYKSNPLEDGSLDNYTTYLCPIRNLTLKSLSEIELKPRDKERCKNFFALGLLLWLFERDQEIALNAIQSKFSKKPIFALANSTSLKAGYAYGENSELFLSRFHVSKASLTSGNYRSISGNQAVAYGLAASTHISGRRIVYGSYPITPASDILHAVTKLKHHNIVSFQAEDEIAAATAAVGASFGGALGVCATSGPGMNLKMESINLAVMAELPLVIIDVQRAGPSTGMPTKTEQSDLLMAMFGRNGESPLVVLPISSPSEAFNKTIEACTLAIQFMTPVILLSDAYIANGSEPWKIPDEKSLSFFNSPNPYHALLDINSTEDGDHSNMTEKPKQKFFPYLRNEHTLVRPWAIPGMKELEHRIGSLEKSDRDGSVSYDSLNHNKMTKLRYKKINRIACILPQLEVQGDRDATLLVLTWGSSTGVVKTACESIINEGKKGKREKNKRGE